MCRRFGYLSNRLLLYKQDELREMEDELATLDQWDQIGPEEARNYLRSRVADDDRTDLDDRQTRYEFMKRLELKLKEYCKPHL